MVKSLIETYKTLKEATNVFRAQAAGLGAAPAAPAPKPVDAKAQGFPARPAASPSTSGTSTTFGGRPAPSNAINNLGRVSQKPEARPMPMGGSVPGRQVNTTVGNTMQAGRSSSMQGRPAGSPTQAVNVNRKVISTGNPNVAGGTAPVRPGTPTQTSGPKRPPPGGFISPQAAMKAGQNFNVGSTGGVVSRPAEPGKTPTLDRTIPKSPVYPNKGMAGSPLDQTQGARPEVGRDYRLNQMRQNPPALDTKRDASLDSPNEKSPMARATNPNIGGAGGGNYKAAQMPSVKATGNPNVAGGTAPVKPGQPVRAKKPGVVQKPNAPVQVARKSQPAGKQNNMTPAQRAQKNRQIERGNTSPAKKNIGLGVNTGKVTKKVVNSKRPIGSSPLKEGAMTNKQLSEMIKQIREKKLLEIIGKPGPFDPAHHSGTHGEDPQSPNQYVKKKSVDEARTPVTSGGAQGISTLGGTGLKNRTQGQRSRGNQNIVGRSLNSSHLGEQDDIDLGTTDTGQTGKKAEKVTVHPKDTTFSARSSTNQNTNIKEIKEK